MQIAVFFIVKIPVPNLSAKIAAGELAAAIWLGLSSLAAGALNAASMIYLTMDDKPAASEFGKRGPFAPQTGGAAVKRSGHVALLLMGTVAVGGGAYALMPRGNCQPPSPGMAAPAVAQPAPTAARADHRPAAAMADTGRRARSFFSSDTASSHASSGGTSGCRIGRRDTRRVRLVRTRLLGAFLRAAAEPTNAPHDAVNLLPCGLRHRSEHD